jgi:hypothetical protein
MANIFDKEVEIKTLKVNDKIIRYNKETYPRLNYTCFVINCPKYLHTALRSRYGSKYGVDVCNNNHLTIENENGIVEIYNEIQKGKNIYETYHKGQTVEMSYGGSDHNFDIVVVKGQYTDFWTYLVNHSKKSVSPIHGYPGHGREYATKMGYKYNNLYKE